MESFLFAAGAVAPIVLTIALGYCLKRIGLMSMSFATAANKVVFRVFLPTMLFLNVYNLDSVGDISLSYIVYAVVSLLALFLLCVPLVKTVTREPKRRGVLLQGVFRSNYALIGIPLAQSLFGDEGVAVASLLSAAVIPLFNVLAVISLSLFRKTEDKKPTLSDILGDIVRNPLI